MAKANKERLLRAARKMREVLKDESRWIQGAEAVTASGHGTDPRNQGAAQFCLLGAAKHVTKSEDVVNGVLAEFAKIADPEQVEELRTLDGEETQHVYDEDLVDVAVDFNDSNGHEEVISTLRRLIKNLSRRTAKQ